MADASRHPDCGVAWPDVIRTKRAVAHACSRHFKREGSRTLHPTRQAACLTSTRVLDIFWCYKLLKATLFVHLPGGVVVALKFVLKDAHTTMHKKMH